MGKCLNSRDILKFGHFAIKAPGVDCGPMENGHGAKDS